jgi:hypothetical protein
MIGITKPGYSPETRIIIQTRKGTDISNSQFHELTHFELAQAADLSKKYLGVTIRTSPNPLYNCHGFTFGSRRSGIYDIDLSKIIQEDGYSEIQLVDVLAGDIILYFDRDGYLSHSGIVTEKPISPLMIPIIVSKWGKFGEIIHPAHLVPDIYGIIRRYYRITQWN